MKKKKIVVLVLQFALLIGLVISFITFVNKEVEPTKVLMYKEDVAVGEKVKITDEEIPGKAVQDNMVTLKEVKDEVLKIKKEQAKEEGKSVEDVKVSDKEALKHVNDKYATVDVFAKEFVYEGQYGDEGSVDPFDVIDLSKMRKISLPIDYVEGFGGDIERGDHIDLIFTGQGEKEDGTSSTNFQYSKVFLQDVLVYSVTTGNGFEFVDHSGRVEGDLDEDDEMAVEGASEELAVVTLAVTLDQAEEIKARQASGEISFASRFDNHDSYETLGYVYGDYEKIFSAPANAETSVQ